ncbi:hypothetical protein [Nostoc sp. ChiQUE01b]|nr:hypothetical protein [Nostoc sp. ChiQUE01b]
MPISLIHSQNPKTRIAFSGSDRLTFKIVARRLVMPAAVNYAFSIHSA